MTQVTCDIGISLDGVSAGVNQSREQPFGDGVGDGELLHAWMFEHAESHRAEIDTITAAGAFVMGRHMFTPGRGEWDLGWRGWWGEDPPYHAPVFVLTHHEREPLEMEGGTTFHFVTGGPQEALERAREAAGDRDVSVAGGATTVNQLLALDLIDELRLHVAPVVLDVAGVRLFDGVGQHRLRPAGGRITPEVAHLTYRR
ncbi:dihydrofolate reductase family protein [Isoptericola sp. 4D.3]|uniref:Dihydrofolate reductase family protein n=1 Tax=Isoptericola peretonis TaxID=2918523 RepID=A0ABT0J1N7_9MICO|nr:dihydrofolate reductase family protein [Isoptericola sp. 4D.3]